MVTQYLLKRPIMKGGVLKLFNSWFQLNREFRKGYILNFYQNKFFYTFFIYTYRLIFYERKGTPSDFYIKSL